MEIKQLLESHGAIDIGNEYHKMVGTSYFWGYFSDDKVFVYIFSFNGEKIYPDTKISVDVYFNPAYYGSTIINNQAVYVIDAQNICKKEFYPEHLNKYIELFRCFNEVTIRNLRGAL